MGIRTYITNALPPPSAAATSQLIIITRKDFIPLGLPTEWDDNLNEYVYDKSTIEYSQARSVFEKNCQHMLTPGASMFWDDAHAADKQLRLGCPDIIENLLKSSNRHIWLAYDKVQQTGIIKGIINDFFTQQFLMLN